MTKFISVFAADIEKMLDYREALGFSRRTYESALSSFDRYAAAQHPNADILNREIAAGWINTHLGKSDSGISNKATALRHFGRYLSAIGSEAYILPDEYVSPPKSTFTPYIFTDDELTRLFRAIDSLSKNPSNPLSQKIPPVLFRLIYTCGLRPNEGRELLRENIDLRTGEVFITKTKRKKERIVVMSGDMLMLCKKYSSVLDKIGITCEYFFPDKTGKPHAALQLERWIKRYWAQANPEVPADKLPNIRVYDLRHRFASGVLNMWLDEKHNLYNKLPYLRAYMGHDTLAETAHYIHILPENIVKSAGIDWEIFEALIPCVGEGATL
jgi:integrase